MIKPGHCNTEDCTEAVASSLNGEGLCRTHFISVCYAKLERYDEMQKSHAVTIADAETMRRFVNECSRQADEIEHTTKDLDNLERAKLLHIILSANELGSHLRRSPRKAASISVRVSCDKIGGAWEEDTETVLLSRHGASVRCTHSARLGENLQIIRSDTGQKAQARVAWQRPLENESVRLGIEFVDCDNFWELDWAEVEETRHPR